MRDLTADDIQDRINLRVLYEKRLTNSTTREGFFYFEDQEFMVAQGQETFLVVAGDMAVGFPLFMNGQSDLHKLEWALTLLRQGEGRHIDELWDVGANIGSICIPAISRNLVERAVAFEPEARLYKLLRANAILNSVEDKLKCHNVALGQSQQTAELTMMDGNTGDYRVAGKSFENDSMGESNRKTQIISMKSANDFVSDFKSGSTLIFMDIQGYEGLALSGASEILMNSPPLVAEFWPYGMKRLDSYKLFRETLCSGLYDRFADLSQMPEGFRPLSAKALDDLYEQISEDSQSSTDILFV